jgi:hypothetical protein
MRRGLLLAMLAGLLPVVTLARPAAASCNTDIDCYGPLCGDPVCQWGVGVHSCVAAGTQPQGFDGECASDSDCKCRGQGATCDPTVSHCTFTLSMNAGDAGASSGSGGGSGTGSSSGTTPGAGGCAVGGPGAGESMSTLVYVLGLMLARRRGKAGRGEVGCAPRVEV